MVATVFAITIVGAAIGKRGYDLLAAVELGLLATILARALRWRGKLPQPQNPESRSDSRLTP